MTTTRLSLLAAPRTALLLLLALTGTLLLFERGIIGTGPVAVLLAALALALTACTLRRWRALRASTLLVHLGTLVILAGGGLSSLGFVATKNIHAGTATRTFFRWDLEQEAGLGFTVRVGEVTPSYYPARVRIGVLRNGRKDRLLEVVTGEAVTLDGWRLVVRDLDPVRRTLLLEVRDRSGRLLALLAPEQEFQGYAFRLVAFQTPRLRQVSARLQLIPEHGPPVESEVAINRPLAWQGYQISLTNFAHDPTGRPYIGLQVSRDPGRPVVYAGFLLLGAGILLGIGRTLAGRSGRPGRGDFPRNA